MRRSRLVWRRCWCLGAALYAVCRLYPPTCLLVALGVFMGEYLATATEPGLVRPWTEDIAERQHPPLWRSVCFIVGVLSF